MERNEEPELSLLLTPVDPPDGEEGQGKPEGGYEVHHSLPHHALAKLGRTEYGMAGHQHQVDEKEEQEIQSILSDVCCQGV